MSTPRECQVGETPLTEREEYRGMRVTRLPSEDPEAVRARDGARLDGIGDGTDPIAYLGEPE